MECLCYGASKAKKNKVRLRVLGWDRSHDSRSTYRAPSLPGSTGRLLEAAVLVGEPLGNGRECGGPLAQGYGLGELSVDLSSALAKSCTERDQSLRQDENADVGNGRRSQAVHESVGRDVLGQVGQNVGHDLRHQGGVAPTEDDPGSEAHAVLQGALEHVVDGLLLRGDLRVLGTEASHVVCAREALVDLEVAVRYDRQAAAVHTHGGGSLGVLRLHLARLSLSAADAP